MNKEQLEKAIGSFFTEDASKAKLAHEQLVASLVAGGVPIEDAEVAVALEEHIQDAGKRAMAEAGASLIRDRLRETSLSRQIFNPTQVLFVTTKTSP